MKIKFPPLPYSEGALAPALSQEAMSLHYGRHHKTYFDKTVEMIEGTQFEDSDLEDIIRDTAKEPKFKKLFNNAAQHWNHCFFWECMRPGGGGKPTGPIGELIDRDLDGYDNFRKVFKQTAVDQFGSGWAWLTIKGGELDIESTSNGNNPLTTDARPLLTVDVWEHAYYVDYRNKRPDFVEAFLDKLVNWDKVNERLGAEGGAQKAGAAKRGPAKAASR